MFPFKTVHFIYNNNLYLYVMFNDITITHQIVHVAAVFGLKVLTRSYLRALYIPASVGQHPVVLIKYFSPPEPCMLL